MAKQITLECYECEALLVVDDAPDDPEELAEWGEHSAECIECGEEYKHLQQNADGSWTDSEGRRLNVSR